MSDCQSPIIVALDFPDKTSALKCLDQLNPNQCRVKVGKQLFVKEGPAFIEAIQARGFDVFLDLKFYDIPNTVAGAVKSATELGVWMLTLHASGGATMMRAAMDAARSTSGRSPIVVAVTLLTSFDDVDIHQIGYRWPHVSDGVLQLATLAQQSGVDGVVCSAHEATSLKQACGDRFVLVTPGIRPASDSVDDQKRVVTPKEALAAGSHYLVIGRPIAQADDPANALKKIIVDINA